MYIISVNPFHNAPKNEIKIKEEHLYEIITQTSDVKLTNNNRGPLYLGRCVSISL